MSVTGSSNAVALPVAAAAAAPPTGSSSIVTVLQQLVATLGTLVQTLQAQAQASGAQAGAANLTGGGPSGAPDQASAAAPAGGCGCCGGAAGAATGVDQLAEKGAKAAPPAKAAKPGGAAGAPAPPVAAAPPAGGNEKGNKVVEFAKAQLGKAYKYGAVGPDTFDCSGLTSAAMKRLGISIPRVAADQAKSGAPVEKQDLRPGDLVFFSNASSGGGVGHTGIYIGDGKFIHAPKTGDVVKVSSLSDSYYTQHWKGARRYT